MIVQVAVTRGRGLCSIIIITGTGENFSLLSLSFWSKKGLEDREGLIYGRGTLKEPRDLPQCLGALLHDGRLDSEVYRITTAGTFLNETSSLM